jgi:hypothetical protein
MLHGGFGLADRLDPPGLGDAGDVGDLGVGGGVDGLGLGLAPRARDFRGGFLGGDLHVALGGDHALAGVRFGLGPFEFLPGLFGLLLRAVCFDLAFGDLLFGQGLHQFSGRRDVADQGVDGLDAVAADRLADP